MNKRTATFVLNERTGRWTRLVTSEFALPLVQFVVLAPAMVLLLLGIIEFGRYMYGGILVANAALAQ